MKNESRALGESLFLHGLLTGALIILAGALTPAPKTIRLDFTLFDPPPDQLPNVAKAAVFSPSPHSIAEQASPEPQPAKKMPVSRVIAVPTKKMQFIKKKTISEFTAVQQDFESALQSEADNSAQVIATTKPAVSASTAASGPVADTPAMDPGEEYRRANFNRIRNAIIANLRYPMMARRRGWCGKVEVTFLIAPDGSVSEVKILASSGHPLLDEQAIEAIRKAAPFTPPRIAALLVMPVTFQLN